MLYFFLIFVVGAVLIVLHNKYRSIFSDVVIILILSSLSLLLSKDVYQRIVFFAGLTLGYLIEFLSVYLGKWKYNTNNGYLYWIGFGWGYVSLCVYELSFSPPLVLIILVALSLYVILRQGLNLPKSWLKRFFLFAKMAGIFFLPGLVCASFSIGILIDYFGIEYFKTWSFRHKSYLVIGCGYVLMMVIVNTIAGVVTRTASLMQMIYATFLILLYLVEYGYDFFISRRSLLV